MKRIDLQELRDFLEKAELQELKERINEILGMFKGDEIVEIMDNGKVIAHIVPVSAS